VSESHSVSSEPLLTLYYSLGAGLNNSICLDLLSVLNSLMDVQVQGISKGAAEALAAGFELLYPDAVDRQKVLYDHLKSHSSIPYKMDEGKYALISRLLLNHGYYDTIVSLLPVRGDDISDISVASNLLTSLFRLVVRENKAMLQRGAATHSHVKTNLHVAATQLLTAHLLHTVTSILKKVSEPPCEERRIFERSTRARVG